MGGVAEAGSSGCFRIASIIPTCSSISRCPPRLRPTSQARRAGKPILIGTTGLGAGHHRLIDEAAAEIPLIYAANTSLGVNLLAFLVRETAARLGEDWDLEIVEMHHRMKADAPSGTALMLGRAAADGRGVELDAVAERGREGSPVRASRGGSARRASRRPVAGEHLASSPPKGEDRARTTAERPRNLRPWRDAAAACLVGKPAGRYAMADGRG